LAVLAAKETATAGERYYRSAAITYPQRWQTLWWRNSNGKHQAQPGSRSRL